MEPYLKSLLPTRVKEIEYHGNIKNTKRDISISYESSHYILRTERSDLLLENVKLFEVDDKLYHSPEKINKK
jgi:hypothetical protein